MNKMMNDDGLDYDVLDKLTSDFFNKENEILSDIHFANYMFAVSKGSSRLKRGKVIRVYPTDEFASMNQEWFLACDFSQIVDWLSKDKETKKDMYFIGEAKALYDKNPNFCEYMNNLGLEQYFQHKEDTSFVDFFFK